MIELPPVSTDGGTIPELTDAMHYPTRDAAMASIRDYLERFYNPARRHSHLGYFSPVEFELRAQARAFLMWNVLKGDDPPRALLGLAALFAED